MRLPAGIAKRLLSPATLAVAVCIVSLAVFLPALKNGFVAWDDGPNLVDNPYYRGLGWPQLRWIWTNHLMEHYVPLAWMSFALDYVLWQQRSFGYHLTNILIHSLNAGLFFWLALRLFQLARPLEPTRTASLIWGAAAAALFFSLHPLRVESVAWVTERRDVLSGCFYLLAVLAYLRRFRSHERKYYWFCLALFVASVLSKEITVTLPVALLVLDVYPLGRLGGSQGCFGAAARQVWIEKIPFFAVSVLDAAMTIYVAVRDHLPDTMQAMGWIPRFTITVYGMAFYLAKTIAPVHLSPLYPLTRYKASPMAVPFVLSAIVVLFVTYAAFRLRRRWPVLLAAWTVYSVTLLPVGGIVHNGNQITADRYTYLSCMGWALLFGAAVMACLEIDRFHAPAWRAPLVGFLVLLAAALGWQTRAQIHYWHDSETLWRHAIGEEASPLALTNLGAAYFNEGDSLGALDLYQRAIQMDPAYALAHNNLGGAYLDLHRLDEAIHEFQIAQELMPAMAAAYNGKGNALSLEGKLDEAISNYRRAVELNPDYAGARKNLERALAHKQRQSSE